MKAIARNILSDLVEKRLWPVVVALLAALAAVPVVVHRGNEPTAPAATPAAPRQRANEVELTMETAPAVVRHAAPVVRDPFAQAHAAAATSTTSTSAPTSATAPSASTVSPTPASSAGSVTPARVSVSIPASSSAPSSSVVTPLPTSRTTPSPGAAETTGSGGGGEGDTGTPNSGSGRSGGDDGSNAGGGRSAATRYSVTLRFGRTDGERTTLRDLARFTPLPNAEDPVVALVGVLQGGRRAVFAVSPQVTASGSGACRPASDACWAIAMGEDHVEYLKVSAPDGTVTAWYYLKVLHVDRVEGDAPVGAAAAVARDGSAGLPAR